MLDMKWLKRDMNYDPLLRDIVGLELMKFEYIPNRSDEFIVLRQGAYMTDNNRWVYIGLENGTVYVKLWTFHDGDHYKDEIRLRVSLSDSCIIDKIRKCTKDLLC